MQENVRRRERHKAQQRKEEQLVTKTAMSFDADDAVARCISFLACISTFSMHTHAHLYMYMRIYI